jgi:endonuclease YncB( thermonuclease family)
MRFSIILFTLILVSALTAIAQLPPKIQGRVVVISDGYTVTVSGGNNVQSQIRLQEIDAPEDNQAFGKMSRQNLSDLLFNKQVTVEWGKRDRYRRIPGKILLDGRDISLEQVKAGLAWFRRDYQRGLSEADRKLYAEAEAEAKEARRGLWADAASIPPWAFRRGGRRSESGVSRRIRIILLDPPDTSGIKTVEADPALSKIIGDMTGKKYYLPGCPGYDQVTEENRVLFSSEKEAEAAGYTKEGDCQKVPSERKATSQTNGETRAKVGIPECDDYLEKFEDCLMSKGPEAARAQYQKSFTQMRAAWR